MSEMNSIICNKCFTPVYRGKRPYHITQCGHISCQNCLQQVENQCPQCQRSGTMSLALEEPLIPKLAPFFQPLAETLETLLKVDTFRSNQLKITMQRFYELDKKYEMLKTQYWLGRRNLKVLTEKYVSLKNEKDKLDKKLLFSEMQRRTPRSVYCAVETPSDSGVSVQPSSSGYSLESAEFLKSADITPMRSTDLKKQYRTTDGFRVPFNCKPPRSIGSRNILS